MDVVWLKRDVRLIDHGPLAEISRSPNPFLILYLYEPDQLSEPSVHGSHVNFVHEGLVDLDKRLKQGQCSSIPRIAIDDDGRTGNASGGSNESDDVDRNGSGNFEYLTVSHNSILSTLNNVHRHHHRIGRLLAHEETGHYKSYTRDRAVRKWCKSHKIPFREFQQSGVTRRLKARDDFSQKLNAFLAQPLHPTPNLDGGDGDVRKRCVVLRNLPGAITSYLPQPEGSRLTDSFPEIPEEHRGDRPGRTQRGGQSNAEATLVSFLQNRGSSYSAGISSPNSSWTSCSRLSPYITWGHVSLRSLVHALKTRQDRLRDTKRRGGDVGPWLRSLQNFSSRLHWRAHFIQKLESEPLLEKHDLCPAYRPLRRRPGDYDPALHRAWETGRTGFPFLDACMRCLLEHGWLNFRMRAMLVSFATYNLWLDWKVVAPHLARTFLDYEPGIHYPQLQMQSGTTGINAMRVYNVTKQGKDQDPEGRFVRRYVGELGSVPDEYVHEPWKMPRAVRERCGIVIGGGQGGDGVDATVESPGRTFYPGPIVDERESGRTAKAKVAAIKKLASTGVMAEEVYQKHGSRNLRQRDRMEGSRKPKAATASTIGSVKEDTARGQRTITAMFATGSGPKIGDGDEQRRPCPKMPEPNSVTDTLRSPDKKRGLENIAGDVSAIEKQQKVAPTHEKIESSWSCHICTLVNDKPHGLACSLCATPRANNK